MSRRFYRGKVTMEYVSEGSMQGKSLADILEECEHGDALAGPVSIEQEEIIRRSAADKLAVAYGSDESFFNLGV